MQRLRAETEKALYESCGAPRRRVVAGIPQGREVRGNRLRDGELRSGIRRY